MKLTRFFERTKSDKDRAREIESYVEIETDENIARGMSYDEAQAAAHRKFGNCTLVREEIYRMNTITAVDALARDIRFSWRMLRKSPAFTTVALLTLAIGIGANSAVFSVVNSVLLKPLPYPRPEELVSLRQVAPGAAGLANFLDGLPLSGSMYFTYADHNRTFQSLGVWVPANANVTGVAEPEQVRVVAVSDGVLESLNVAPVAGRWFSANDQIPHGAETVILGYGYWRHRFAGDPSAIGRTLRVDGRPRQIVGVMPKGFQVVDADFDLLAPLALDRSKETLAGFGLKGIGRLKQGVTIGQANGDISRMLPIWMDSWSNGPGTNSHFYESWRITPALRPLKQEVTGNVGQALWVVMATLAIVMLIACANVANLLLVRTEARQQELAIRTALGAGRARLVRELLVESVMLGLIGGALGIGLAYGGLQLLLQIGTANLPRLNEISLDGRSVVFTLLLSVFSGVIFGSIPALKFAGRRIYQAMRSAGRNASVSRERHRARNLLVIAQVALALVLLVSAGLMIRTFGALRTVQPGFTDARHIQTVRISIPASLMPDPQRVTRTQNEIVDRLSRLPGVSSAAFANDMPMEGYQSMWDMVYARDQSGSHADPPLRYFKYVSPGFFHTAGTRLIAGRDITWSEVYAQRPVVLVSENLARDMWGSPASAVGKKLREFAPMPWHEVIGVVENVRENGIQENPPAIVYWTPFRTNMFGVGPLDALRPVTVIVRTERAGSKSFVDEIRHTVWSVNPSLPVASIQTMQEVYDHSLARTSFTLVMLAIAGAMALVLGVIGIYGVIAYAVSQRRREIGIRLALGAEQGDLKRMFVHSGLRLAGLGVGVGLIAAISVTRFMKSLLFGISPLDGVTYATVPLVLAAAAALASYLPARRAARVDPVESLRAE